jgi:hypothetical protein
MQKRHYPELSRIWIENARRTRQGLPLIPVPLVMTPAAIRMRELRALRRRREDYEGRASALRRNSQPWPGRPGENANRARWGKITKAAWP